MKVKEEYRDLWIQCPFTRKDICVRFIPEGMYGHYYNNGFSFLFENKIKKNVISK